MGDFFLNSLNRIALSTRTAPLAEDPKTSNAAKTACTWSAENRVP
jgi:hypothetical protein